MTPVCYVRGPPVHPADPDPCSGGPQFNNMSRVMDVVNANATNGVSVRYSTVSEYFNALPINEQPPVFSRVTDPNTDFLPYNMLPNQFWCVSACGSSGHDVSRCHSPHGTPTTGCSLVQDRVLHQPAGAQRHVPAF